MALRTRQQKITEDSDDVVFKHAEAFALSAVEEPQHIETYHHYTREAQKREGGKGWRKGGKMTQSERIIKHIKENGSISQREAILDLTVSSFFRRLTDIEQHHGIKLRREQRKNPATGQAYTRVSFANPEEVKDVA